MPKCTPGRALAALAVYVIAPAPLFSATATGETGMEALEIAFRFASAITPDPKDMGKAQELVVVDMATSGNPERAAELAEKITDWRRGTSLGTIARLYAVAGNESRARALLSRAELEVKRTGGWQKVRVEAHASEARAWLGDLEAATEAAARLAQADPLQYAGRAATIVVIANAVHGNFDKVMELAGALDASEDYSITVYRTLAYLEIFKLAKDNPELRRLALEKTMASAEEIPGWKRAEIYGEITRALEVEGRKDEARESFRKAVEDAQGIGSATPVKGLVLAEIVRTGSDLGVTEGLRPLLEEAMKASERALVIERPGIYGHVASAYFALGDTKPAGANLDRALTTAEDLVNARPRALAIVDILRYVGREGMALEPATRTRLDAIFRGLKAPW
jgi:tetratricopeptide (TPR) repeat protein